MALGNGANDIASIIAGAINGAENMSIAEPIGAGTLICTLVIGVVIIMSHDVKVTRRPFMRDVIYYCCAVLYTMFIAIDGQITFTESVSFLLLYILYVTVVLVGRYIFQRWKKQAKARAALNVQCE